MFCNHGCGGVFGIGIGRMPHNLPFMNGCGNGCGCDSDVEYEPARGDCCCNR